MRKLLLICLALTVLFMIVGVSFAADQKVLTVDNPDALTGHEGHHVAVTGQVNGESVHVESVKML